MSLNDLNEEYINILKENGVQETSSNYKKLIQDLIKDNIPNAEIRGSYRRNECNIVTSKETINSILATHLDDDDEGDMKVLLEAALILRKDIKNFPEWQFTGTFDDFEVPEKLNAFCRWTVTRNKRNFSGRRTNQAESSASVLAQHFISA